VQDSEFRVRGIAEEERAIEVNAGLIKKREKGENENEWGHNLFN
jgi:hypothetical protein